MSCSFSASLLSLLLLLLLFFIALNIAFLFTFFVLGV